jgi:hypothetical protein
MNIIQEEILYNAGNTLMMEDIGSSISKKIERQLVKLDKIEVENIVGKTRADKAQTVGRQKRDLERFRKELEDFKAKAEKIDISVKDKAEKKQKLKDLGEDLAVKIKWIRSSGLVGQPAIVKVLKGVLSAVLVIAGVTVAGQLTASLFKTASLAAANFFASRGGE